MTDHTSVHRFFSPYLFFGFGKTYLPFHTHVERPDSYAFTPTIFTIASKAAGS